MAEFNAVLRWFPLGPIEGPLESITEEGLEEVAKQCGVSISLENMRGAVQGETRGRAIEEIMQHIVHMSADDEGAFRQTIRALVKKYRAPRTTFAPLGSDERAERIIRDEFNEEDGWY